MIKDRIKELREKNGLTISAFAKSLGISPTSASLYESGKQNPGKKTIAKICEVYGVDEGYLSSSASTAKATLAAKEDDGAVVATPPNEPDKAPTDETAKAVEEKERGRRPKKTDVVNVDEKETAARAEEKEPDITAILARVAEVGVRKAADEAGVAWQTVNKWKKDAEKAALSSSDNIQKTLDNLTTPEGAQGAVTASDEEMEEQKQEKKDQIDITAVLARVAEVGVRKAAAEAGVAWQTVNKWKKDAEKAAAALPAPEDIGKSVGEIIEAAGEISDGIQKTLDNLTTPEGAQEAVTEVMEMVTPETEEKEQKEEQKKEIDITAVLARVAEIGVRKAAAEIGVAWQTVNKWKKDAAATQTPPITSIQEKKEEKKEEKKQEKKQPEENDDVVDAEEKKTAIIIQSPLGGAITPEQILQKIPAGSDSVYVRVDENKLYWVKGDENGAVDIWD